MTGLDPGVARAVAQSGQLVTVYAPEGSCTRFRRPTIARKISQSVLGGMVLSVTVEVDGEPCPFVVPPAWIDPRGAPPAQPARACVVIPFPGRA